MTAGVSDGEGAGDAERDRVAEQRPAEGDRQTFLPWRPLADHE